MELFDRAFAIVIGEEGGYTAEKADPGNWTGGRCGVGNCLGTNWGISASAYPHLDIANLTQDQAKSIYRQDYWDRIMGDKLPPPLALLVFDAAVNNGVSQAIRWLQAALKVPADGVAGSGTVAAIAAQAGRWTELCAAFQTSRLIFMSGLATWKTFGNGWASRLCALPFKAMTMGEAA